MTSKRAGSIEPSATIRISDLVKEMREQGEEVISLSIGAPDFNTPEEIKDAAKQALDENKTSYTASAGISELKEAIRNKFERENGIETETDNVMITPGGKFSIYLICQSLIDKGDKVGIFDPAWVSYPPNAKLAGGWVEWLETDEEFYPDLECLKEKAPDLKLLILNSPNNPTGQVYSEDLIRDISEVAEDNDLPLLSDEVYEKLIFDGEHYSPGSDFPNVITLNSCSKPFAMAGWRVGYFTGPEDLVEAAKKIQSHSVSCATSIAQHAAVEALTSEEVEKKVEEMRKEFEERRDLVSQTMEDMEGIDFVRPRGAFYLFFRFDLDVDSLQFSESLLKEKGVAVTPGSAFGEDRESWIRMSFANTKENLREALDRMEEFLRES